MKKFATACSIAAMLSLAAAAPTLAQQKMSQSECDAAWNRADSTKSGSISQTQAQSYVSNFKAVDTNNDGNLSKSEFSAGCSKGLVRNSSATTGSGTGSGGGMSGSPSTNAPKK